MSLTQPHKVVFPCLARSFYFFSKAVSFKWKKHNFGSANFFCFSISLYLLGYYPSSSHLHFEFGPLPGSWVLSDVPPPAKFSSLLNRQRNLCKVQFWSISSSAENLQFLHITLKIQRSSSGLPGRPFVIQLDRLMTFFLILKHAEHSSVLLLLSLLFE